MNAEKLSKLQAQVRIGGKGTARRKKKIVHRTATTDDKKLQSSLKKLSVNNIPGIEEVNMIKDDGTVIRFNNPKVQASLAANTFSISGHNETKQISEMLPSIINQLGPESLTHLKRLASNVQTTSGKKGGLSSDVNEDDDDEVPVLVENFEEASKAEASIQKEKKDEKNKSKKEEKTTPSSEAKPEKSAKGKENSKPQEKKKDGETKSTGQSKKEKNQKKTG